MYKFKVKEIIKQPNNNVSIRFEDMSGNFPRYKAGQFLTLVFEFGDREVRRSYSFSSSPDYDDIYEITVKRVENGEISRFLHHKLAEGDILNVMDPQGLFVYDFNDTSDKKIFLFAAGVGITPLYSIMKSVLLQERNSQIILVYSNSSKESTLFYDELIQWQREYPERLHLEFIWSNSKNLSKARLNRDYLISLVESYGGLSKVDNIYFTCGPLFYMDLVRFTLLGLGVPDSNIKRETFHFPEEEEDDDEKEEVVEEIVDYNVILQFNGQDYHLVVPSNESILNVGLSQKIKLPYSCKSGMCSTCISQVVKGGVRMDYNEVLTDREVDNGKCLICVSHPTEDNTIIQVY